MLCYVLCVGEIAHCNEGIVGHMPLNEKYWVGFLSVHNRFLWTDFRNYGRTKIVDGFYGPIFEIMDGLEFLIQTPPDPCTALAN